MCGRERGAVVGWLAVAAFGLLPACGNSGPPPQAALESALSCAGGWQPLLTLSASSYRSPLGYHDGVLFYYAYPDQAVRSLRISDGSTATLADGFVGDLWVEGDQVLFATGDQASLLYSVPATGGTPRLVLDASTGRGFAGNARFHAADANAFYWTEETYDSRGNATVWRASRSDGTPVQIGSVSASNTVTSPPTRLAFMAMALTNDAVLLASDEGVADAVPFDGSAPRGLATTAALSRPLVGWLAGVDSAGVYWTVPREGTSPDDSLYSVILAPADGGPTRTFWEGTPANTAVTAIWPSGDGGWVVTNRQLLDDQTHHLVISMLAADGTIQRLACSPGAEATVASAPVVEPDAIYVVVDGAPSQIVRVAR
jgi:hypothetical protein